MTQDQEAHRGTIQCDGERYKRADHTGKVHLIETRIQTNVSHIQALAGFPAETCHGILELNTAEQTPAGVDSKKAGFLLNALQTEGILCRIRFFEQQDAAVFRAQIPEAKVHDPGTDLLEVLVSLDRLNDSMKGGEQPQSIPQLPFRCIPRGPVEVNEL